MLSRVEAAQHPAVIGQVAALVTQTPAQVEAAIADVQYSPYEPVPILRTAPTATVQYLENHPAEYPGVSVEQVTERQYPQGGSTGAYVLGYVGSITGTELKAHAGQGYTQESQIGKTGVEEEYEQYLRGTPGTQDLEVNAQGNVVGTASTTRATQGDTVVLNLTLGLQQYAQQALTADMAADRQRVTAGRTPKATDGALVVLDAETGAVLALASSPTYSLTTWLGGISTADYQKLSATCTPPLSDACPLNDNAIQGVYTPGSTFKLATATAALNTGIIGPTTYVDDTGIFNVPNCTEGCTFHDATAADAGEVNVTSALVRSDDYFFYDMGYRFWSAWLTTGDKVGQTPIQDTANAYGFGELTGIDLPDEVQGSVATPAQTKHEHEQYPKTYPNGTWSVGTNIEMAFGQGATVVTPIEEAQAYATFADHGTRYQPEVAAEVVDPDGKVLKTFAPKVTGHVTHHRLHIDPRGVQGRGEHTEGHRLRHLQGRRQVPTGQLPHRRQDRHRGPHSQHSQGAQLLVRRVRPHQHHTPVRGGGGGGPGRLRRQRRGPRRGQRLQLPLRQPGGHSGCHPHGRPPRLHSRPDHHPGGRQRPPRALHRRHRRHRGVTGGGRP